MSGVLAHDDWTPEERSRVEAAMANDPVRQELAQRGHESRLTERAERNNERAARRAEEEALLQKYMDEHPNVAAAAHIEMEDEMAEREAQRATRVAQRAERYATLKDEAEQGLIIRPASPLLPTQAKVKKQIELATFGTVQYEEPRFLFSPYIGQNAITIVQGDSGVDKTALICKIAAAVSIGGLMQDVQCEEGNVIVCSVEDDASTLRGRIEASGGDVDKCYFPKGAHDLTFMSEELDDMIDQVNAKMVVFDPLQAFLGAKVDMHRANETRPVMARLADLAKRKNCAIVIVSHLSKGSIGGPALYRALGSIDIVAASRSVLYVGRNPRDPGQCAIIHAKHSHSMKGKSLLYRIGGRGGVQWEGYTDLTEKDLETQGTANGTPSTYDEDPLVKFLRQVTDENPDGVGLTWQSFNRYSWDAVEKRFGSDGREIKARLAPLITDLARRDGIYLAYKDTIREKLHIECGTEVDTGIKGRGISIERREQPEEVIL